MNHQPADLRPRMTRRAAQFMEQGAPLLVVGGPLAGKSSMLRHLGEMMPELHLYDDIAPDALAVLVGSGMKNWVASIDAGLLRWPGAFPRLRLLPLVNLAPADLRAFSLGTDLDSRDLLESSAGHPYLVAHHGSREARNVLGERFRESLARVPEARESYEVLQILAGSGLAPVALYGAARRRFGAGCKRRLDLLAVMGAVTRSIIDERAALRLVPSGPPLHDAANRRP